MNKFKIAFIVDHYPPTDGGLATSAQRISRELVNLGVDVHIFCFDSDLPLESCDSIIEENDKGVRVSRVAPFFLKQALDEDSYSENIKSIFRRRAFNQIASVLQKDKMDCILSFFLINSGHIGLLLAREFKLPFVAGVRGNDIGKNIFHIERFGLTQWIVTGADKIVCVNEHLKRRLLLAFPEVESKTVVFPNSISSLKINPNRTKARKEIIKLTRWKESNLIMVFSGVLREKKGIIPLLRGIEISNNTSVRLLIVGPDIGDKEKIICGELWAKLKAQNVIYSTGNISRAKVQEWISAGDIIAMPSLDDGMANGLLEGMVLGLCPLVSDIFSDIIQNNINGIVVAQNDATSIANAINKLSKDRKMVSKFGKTAKLNIQRNHQPKIEASRYLTLIESLVNKA